MKPLLLLATFVLAGFAFGSGTIKQADLVTVTLRLDKGLDSKAKGIRHAYVIFYDPASKMPMPYAAQKFTLKKDPTGDFLVNQKIDTKTASVMRGGVPPKTLRVKVRLDKDGNAGRDATGDIVGVNDSVALGSKVVVTLNKLVP